MSGTRGQLLRGALAAGAAVVLLFPIYWMVVTSLTPGGELLTPHPVLWPRQLSGEHYRRVLADSPFVRFVANSAIVATWVTVLALPLSAGGGYALARCRFRGRRAFGLALLGTQMLPAIMLAIPLYAIIAGLRLIDTHLALILCYTTFAVPFATWVLRGFFSGLPAELEEAARLDGCSGPGVLRRIVLPLSAPGLAATAMLTFLLAWNEYMFAMLFINTEQLKTYPVGITLFTSRWQVDYGALMAASVLVSVPVATLFLVLQRGFVAGLSAGAMKA